MTIKISLFLFILFAIPVLSSAQDDPITVVQKQLDTYNAQDLDGFSSLFAENASVYMALSDTTPAMKGREEIRTRYGKMFIENPENKSTLMGRMVQGNYVFDHELITGRKDTFQIMAIYEVKEGQIQRCWFVR